MTADRAHSRVERALELANAATPGPWRWVLNRKHREVRLEGTRKMLETVMDFTRWGMSGATVRFRSDQDLMVHADEWTSVVGGREHHEDWYRTLIHPDAQFIAESRELVPQLAARVKQLEAERDHAALEFLKCEQAVRKQEARVAELEAALRDAREILIDDRRDMQWLRARNEWFDTARSALGAEGGAR